MATLTCQLDDVTFKTALPPLLQNLTTLLSSKVHRSLAMSCLHVVTSAYLTRVSGDQVADGRAERDGIVGGDKGLKMWLDEYVVNILLKNYLKGNLRPQDQQVGGVLSGGVVPCLSLW